MRRTFALLSLVALVGCDVTITRQGWGFFPRHVQHFVEYRTDVSCRPTADALPFPDLSTLEYNEAVVGTDCLNGTRRDIHLYLEFNVSSIYRRGPPGRLVQAAIYMQPDPESGCSPDTAAISDINFAAGPISRRDRSRLLPAPGTMVDDERWSFRRWHSFQGRGDSLPGRLSGTGSDRYVYPTSARGVEEVRFDLRDDILSVVILAADPVGSELCLERLSPVGLSLTFGLREET
ncbi:hypothetical protein [Histidinibacterium aquaticum]|uniref:Uncharacterized protein n=1 Tax=Histidinibacterium aquaticum TaxID=2613962 RepID=A0A5J5GLA6_9RHOB|nr:hypothetical protein [Histidinibacterium aquaticum]KAA9009025.1 hypothetical protein F3S47_07140 [Histidinibacterium aquaticum]